MDVLSGLDYSALLDKQLRNSLEHFGECLDEANSRHSKLRPNYQCSIAFNMVFSELAELPKEAYPFRAFLASIPG